MQDRIEKEIVELEFDISDLLVLSPQPVRQESHASTTLDTIQRKKERFYDD